MKYACTLAAGGDGVWTARCESADLGKVEARAPDRAAAIEKLKGEIRYRLELCPCSGESYRHLDVEIVEAR